MAISDLTHGPYAFVLFEAVLIGLHVVITGMFAVGAARRKLFNKAFFEKNFPSLKAKFPIGGYPDTGSGRFSEKLSLEDWTYFNNAQRAHMNYVEGAATIIVALLVAGLYQPRLTAVLGAVYILGRTLYATGYVAAGPRGRGVGVLLLDVAMVTLVGVALYSTFQAAGGVKGVLDLVQHIVTFDLWE